MAHYYKERRATPLGKFTHPYPFCPTLCDQAGSLRFRLRWGLGLGGSMSGRARSKSLFSRLPTLRFRAKIMLGFASVLVISAVSLGMAYLRFDRVSVAVAGYRNSVAEA